MHELTAYGHSWVAGEGASRPGLGFVELAARRLGCTATNCGVGGSASTDTAELLSREPPPPSRLYVVMTGLNDARLNGASPAALDDYAAALDAIFTPLHEGKPDAITIIVEQPHLSDYSLHPPHDSGSDQTIDAYNERLRGVATRHQGVVIATVPEWDPTTMLADDTVHPNDTGHLQVAGAVVRAVAAGTAWWHR